MYPRLHFRSHLDAAPARNIPDGKGFALNKSCALGSNVCHSGSSRAGTPGIGKAAITLTRCRSAPPIKNWELQYPLSVSSHWGPPVVYR